MLLMSPIKPQEESDQPDPEKSQAEWPLASEGSSGGGSSFDPSLVYLIPGGPQRTASGFDVICDVIDGSIVGPLT
ncbi:unnamed protein product [Gadus morhua 'NCC']